MSRISPSFIRGPWAICPRRWSSCRSSAGAPLSSSTRVYDATGGSGMWQRQMSFSYNAIAPSFVCLRMEYASGGGGSCSTLRHPAPPRPTPGRPETTIFWVEGITPEYDEMTLDKVLDSEAQVYEEHNPILERIEPGEAPLDLAAQVHTPADHYTLVPARLHRVRAESQHAGRSVFEMGTPAFEPATARV